MVRATLFCGIAALVFVAITSITPGTRVERKQIDKPAVTQTAIREPEGKEQTLAHWNSQEQELQDVRESLPSPHPSFPAAQRRRLADIAAVRDADFDQLTRPLSSSNDAWGMLMVTRHCNDLSTVIMNGVLADRRIMRLYELLAAMPPDQAEETISSAFDARFNDICRRMERSSCKGAGGLHPASQGLSGLLFLCSEFCETEVFLEKLDEWTDWYEAKQSLLPADSQISREFAWVGPSPLFVANLYVNCLIDRGTSMAELNVHLEAMARELALSGFPKLEEAQLSHWLIYADEHCSRPWAVQTVVPCFRSTQPAWEFLITPIDRPNIVPTVLAELRSWVDEEIARKP